MSERTDEAGWTYTPGTHPAEGADCRCLVTLMNSHGLVWVGIRAWSSHGWLNGGEPERDRVLAWMPLPEPAKKRWIHGKLT